jgi:TIR domain
MTGHVFISHSDKDKRFAEMLLQALESRGIRCWIAPRDIPPGGSYAEAILGAIETCACFVLVFTQHANSSGHVLREVERALKFDKNLVPVRFDNSAASRSLDYLLATVQWLAVDIRLAKDSVQRVAEQVATCAGVVCNPPEPSPSPPPRVAAPTAGAAPAAVRRSPKWTILLLLLLAASVAFTIGRVATTRKSVPTSAEQNSLSLISPAQPSVQPTVSPPNADAIVDPSNAPQSALRRYYDCFQERNTATAYSLLSSKFKEKVSFKKFSERFSSTRSIRLIETKNVARNENSASIEVAYEEEDGYFRRVQWRGLIGLVREPAGWRVDTIRDLKRTKLAAASSPPGRLPEKTWDRPHIYLQLANGSQMKSAMELKRQLTNAGYVVVAVESVSGNVDIPTDTSELRYFAATDGVEAQKIAHEIESFFRSTGIVAYIPEGMPYVSHARQYEIWLSSGFR